MAGSRRNSCNGACCASFTLAYSPEEIQRFTEKTHGPDGPKVKDMVIYLGKSTTPPVAPYKPRDQAKLSAPRHWYTCKYFDGETRSCLDYENRPRMCSEFPYAGTCCYSGCRYLGPQYLGRKKNQKTSLDEDKDHLEL